MNQTNITSIQAAQTEMSGGSAPWSAEKLVYYAALLAGLGVRARILSAEVATMLFAPGEPGRTCIDGGSPLVLSVVAPGGRRLGVITRSGPAEKGVLPWLRTYYHGDGGVERWQTETYVGEVPTAWERARFIAERAGQLEILRRTHAIIGPHSHLYSVDWSLDQSRPLARVGWQLDRTLPIDRALTALDHGHSWPTAASFWTALLGYAPDPRRGPWSISLLLGREPRLRLGSTNWARCFEEDDKRRRFAAVIDQQGADRRFAESLYKLIVSASRQEHRGIGRAVELELVDRTAEAAEFYFACLEKRGDLWAG